MVTWPWGRESGLNEMHRDGPGVVPAEFSTAGMLAAVASILPDPFLVLDASGRVLLANAHARDVLDADPQGQHLTAQIRAPVILDAIAQVLRTGEPVRADYERRVPIERRFEAFIARFPSSPRVATGEPVPAVLILLRDLTHQQKLERMRADFVANASHELRTPLASLLGFIETLQGPARADESARERFLTLMRAQAERMRRLIDDLLSLSRIELSAHDRPRATLDMRDVVRHVADVLSSMAREAGVEVDLDLAERLPVKGDRDELVQVLQNLVENAIKYAPSGKRVALSGKVDSEVGRVVVTVRDFGQGIAAEHLPRLTERFYRVSVQESRSRGGTGLGLAIVKHILNRHRGKLAIASTPGEGSTFTVKLPLERG
ncbi:MAG: ATP-binding protein [Parvibaculaceae bacterium]